MSQSHSTKSNAKSAGTSAPTSTASSTAGLEDRQFGPVTVLFGKDRGKYPQGNSLLIRGTRETVLIDASLGVTPRRDSLPRIDRLLFSHCHEDHISGSYLFPEVPWHFHELDLPGIRSQNDPWAVSPFGCASW